jgi:3-oxoacyl-[acyl-carrier-protein] synthase II
MSVHIGGMGWVTPLGSEVTEVWDRLHRGDEPVAETLVDSAGLNPYPAFRVPASALKELPVHPRLRRASAISRFAAAAGMAALRDARGNIGEIDVSRVALVFAISNGGVIYTKRFYHDIVASGADTASPLLFPETVFNAPASHLAALLGVTGPTYTMVGDGAVGLSAVNMAEDLMGNTTLDCCLVVGAEEADWLLCDAYAKWRLLRSQPPIEPFAHSPKGMILSEGAGAIAVTREGAVRIKTTHPGAYYKTRTDLANTAESVLREIEASSASFVVAGANGTFIDTAEAISFQRVVPNARIYTPKPSLGESVGAGGLWQVIVAARALLTQTLPPLLHAPPDRTFVKRDPSNESSGATEAVAVSCGLNQQVSALCLAA